MSAAEALELIQAGLTGLAACDIEPYGAAALGQECERILRATGTLQVEAARRLARFAALGGPASDNAHSLTGWLAHRCRLRPWEAGQLATTATRLHLLGDAHAAFDDGDIGYGDLATIADGVDKAATTMTDGWTPGTVAEAAQPILLEAAAHVTPAQLRKAATRIALTLDGENAERRRRQIHRGSFLDLGQTIDGAARLHADMDAADFAIVEKAVDTFAPRPDPGGPEWENRPGHRRLRGLVHACQAALNAAGRAGYRERGGAPVRVHVIATSATVDPAVPATKAPPARTEYGTILTATAVRDMIRGHHASTVTIHLDGDGNVTDRTTASGRPLNWGRTRRLFTIDQRDVYLALYAACAADGCDRPPAWADIDHKVAWIDGGSTDLDNGQPLCRWHNLNKEHQNTRKPP